MQEENYNISFEGSLGKVVKAWLGMSEGVFGVHLLVRFQDDICMEYHILSLEEIRDFMGNMKASNLEEITGKQIYVRTYPMPLGQYVPA